MTLATGSHLGPYEVTREIGRGGMGVVYLARDTKLDRDVAIKALPAEFAEDKERLDRFEREAKLLASLNHPHIATIHGLEEADGHQYLILEHVEGETLAQRLERGAIPVTEALAIAKQIAEAIESAHEKGVIHRDLKPANIKFTADGEVKVLDFGLAKAIEEHTSTASEIANSPTMTPQGSPTISGVILGTAGYLSPEQARGRPVDKRADIFAFGCVLFEMLTGEKLFTGETVTDSLASTLKVEPTWAALPADTPPTIHLLLRRCLAKNRKRRLQDIGSARVEIDEAISDPLSSSLGLAAAAIAQPSIYRSRRRLLASFTFIVVAGVAAAVTWFATASLRRPPPIVRLVIPSETDMYRYTKGMVVSPDGTQVAFVAPRRVGAGVSDEQLLWVRRLDEFDARELGPEPTGGLFWSHDSRYIGFNADGKLWSIRVDGADKRMLASVGGNMAATWNADGVIIVSAIGQGLRVLRPGAASLEPLSAVNTGTFETLLLHPHFLPDGNRFLYLAVTYDPEQEIRTRTLFAGNLETGRQTMIGSFPSAPWFVESGYLVYVEDGTVKTVPFDADRLRITGEPIVLAQDAFYFKPTGFAAISASRSGVVVFTPVHAPQGLVWFDVEGNRLGLAGTPAIYDDHIRISPDGQTVAASVADPRTAQSDIVLLSLQRDTSRRLTFDARWEGNPVWSRDGKTIFFSTDHRGPPDVYALEVSGDTTPRKVFRESNAWFSSDVSPDGRFLAMYGISPDTGYDIWMVPLDGDGKPFAFIQMRGAQKNAMFSPDGYRIAYVSSETGADEIYIDTFPDPSGGVQVSIHGGSSPVWSPDGKKLYFGQIPADDRDWAVMVVEFSDSDPPAPLPPEALFNPGPFDGFDLSLDGERFLLRIIPDGKPDNHVILHWVEALVAAEPEESR